jgi:hypothetical protein
VGLRTEIEDILPILFLEKNKGKFLFDFQIVCFWVSVDTTKIADIAISAIW